jgi:16S rRNA (guanine527-N7)-methyltransferase
VVEAVAAELHLSNVTAQHSRAEEIKNRKFDFVVSRAVAPLKELWKWSKPLLSRNKKNSFNNGLVCLKGGDLAQEISESNLHPRQISLDDIFDEEYFKGKYLVYVSL